MFNPLNFLIAFAGHSYVQNPHSIQCGSEIGENGTYGKYHTTTSTYMTNTSAEPGKTYYYKVVAVCPISSYGNSAYSNEVSIMVDPF